MHEIKIKPLSVNQAWQGRRYKTDTYKRYEKQTLSLLPALDVSDSLLSVSIEFGFSNASSDIDNPVKPFLDVMQKKYGFDDKKIMELNLRKKRVKKGSEYIRFDIECIM